ncbi:MAG: glucose-1-phosphate thymidylyltransferase RfbA [bacterium]
MAIKGIILAGGAGTRLYPLTNVVCKQLLPVYDKPMIYYPLSTLMLGGIKDILLISTPKDTVAFEELLGDGSHLGINLQYKVQERPEGIAQAFIIGEEFIGKDRICLILGDNIFYGNMEFLRVAIQNNSGACVFAYRVADPERYGVVEFDEDGLAISIEEKPKNPKSHFAVTGLYIYDNQVVNMAKSLRPSTRGEFEITDINKLYMRAKKLKVHKLSRGIAWLDTGTQQSLLEACNFVGTIEARQGLKFGCVEEVAYRVGFIDQSKMKRVISRLGSNSQYASYLRAILRDEEER